MVEPREAQAFCSKSLGAHLDGEKLAVAVLGHGRGTAWGCQRHFHAPPCVNKQGSGLLLGSLRAWAPGVCGGVARCKVQPPRQGVLLQLTVVLLARRGHPCGTAPALAWHGCATSVRHASPSYSRSPRRALPTGSPQRWQRWHEQPSSCAGRRRRGGADWWAGCSGWIERQALVQCDAAWQRADGRPCAA